MVNWKNVNNWHWTEKDYFGKSKDFFESKIGSAIGQKAIIKSFSDFDGIVTVNIRKGKIIPVFDFKTHMLLSDNDLDLSLILEFDSSAKSILSIDFKGALLTSESLDDLEKISCEFNQFLIEAARKDFSLENCPSNPVPKVVNSVSVKVPHFYSDLGSKFSVKWKFYCQPDLIKHAILNPPFPLKDGYFNIHNLIIYKVTESLERSVKLKWKLEGWREFSDVTLDMMINSSGATLLELNQLKVSADFICSASENWEHHFWKPLSIIYGFSFERENDT